VPGGTTFFAEHDDNHVPTLANVSVPPREESSGARPNAPPNQIRVGENLRQPGSMLRQEIWMPLPDVFLALGGQLNVSAEPWA